MKFNVSSRLEYRIQEDSTIILNVHALRTPSQTILEEAFNIEPYIKSEEINSAGYESRLVRFKVNGATNIKIGYQALVDNSFKCLNISSLNEVPVDELPADILTFLNPSRYCQSDKLYRFANNKFGSIEPAFNKVLAISDWIHDNVEYLSGSTNSQTSAYDTVTELAGVCRDFAHLGIALCRALSIPARYFTGYSYLLKPADFHACFEAYLGGEWVIFDATKLAPLNGLVKIATGRDAADTAIANLFGNVNCSWIEVACDLAEEGFSPIFYNPDSTVAVSYS
ncbi:transglutaminase-like domain-containing protein [Desertivirga arenae]|uniref:transglutaminase-like domain-containing protein n=1 Tax=Desertivirga arenae TaxID=2810309 RepID=UPI001A968D7B|nr:transglutaminase family protein [Pedobacter sp. SYSU D00823]